MLWSVVERLTSQGIYLAVSLILARLILPEIYGVVAIVSSIINILAVVVQSGFSSALIYTDDADIRHYSTAFWGTFFVTGFLYIIAFFSAPAIASYYGVKEIASYIRVMSLQLIFQGIQSIPFAYVSKHMLFRKNYYATGIGVAVSAGVAIFLALFNLEPWALILMTSVEVVVATVVLWSLLKFKIKFYFDFSIAKDMVRYCWKLVGVDLLNALNSSLNGLIIGKFFSKEQVAYYNKGYSLPQMILGSLNTAISKVLFPAFSENKARLDEVRDMLRRSVRLVNYIVFPVLFGIAIVAEAVITILYGENWLGVAPYLQIMCLVWLLQPVQTCAIQSFKALDKSDVFLKLEIAKKVCSIVIMVGFILLMKDAIALAWALLAGQILSAVINMPVLKRYLQYGYKMQIADLMDSAWNSLILILTVWGVGLIVEHFILKTVLQVITGVAVYVGVSILSKNENYAFLWSFLKNKATANNKAD